MRYLLVDGHSVIFAWPDLRKLHTQRTALAREELVKRLTEYQDVSGVRVVAVFDGKGPKNSEETAEGGIQVFYSAGNKSADSIIERLVAKYGKEHDMTVVTNDLLEQQTAITFGGLAISAEALHGLLEDTTRELARRIKAHRRK